MKYDEKYLHSKLPNSRETSKENISELLKLVPVIKKGEYIKIGNGLTLSPKEKIEVSNYEKQRPTYRLILKDNRGANIESAFQIDFTPTYENVTSLNYTHNSMEIKIKAMRDFVLNLLKLIELLETSVEFEDIGYLKGITDIDMENFTIKLGFKKSNFGVIISKSDLVDQKINITNKLIILEKRIQRK